jgi:hypothetical protein
MDTMPKGNKPRSKQRRLRQVHPDAAGIDLGAREHYVAVPEDRDAHPVRHFSCFTPDLFAMADWLESCGIKTVAMEATGVYWIPVFQILEGRGFEVVLVNAKHFKSVPGRKSDVQDCQWLQHLHESGLLAGSFRPADTVCVLRSYMRQRATLVKDSSRHVQRMQKALDQMNLHLHKVIRDITGETGKKIIRAIIDGERDPARLAAFKNYRVRASFDTIAKALTGDYREEHLFCLRQEFELYEMLQRAIAACDEAIMRQWNSFTAKADPSAAPAPKSRAKNTPERLQIFRATGVDLTAIDGMNALTVQTIVAEVGFDMTKWKNEKQFASWLRLCPNNVITGGNVKRSRTQPTTSRAANAFRIAAWTLSNSNSYLGAYYRRMRAKKGAQHAITATAHKLARIFYRMLRYGRQYVDLGANYYQQKYKERILNSSLRRIRELGIEVQILEKPAVYESC